MKTKLFLFVFVLLMLAACAPSEVFPGKDVVDLGSTLQTLSVEGPFEDDCMEDVDNCTVLYYTTEHVEGDVAIRFPLTAGGDLKATGQGVAECRVESGQIMNLGDNRFHAEHGGNGGLIQCLFTTFPEGWNGNYGTPPANVYVWTFVSKDQTIAPTSIPTEVPTTVVPTEAPATAPACNESNDLERWSDAGKDPENVQQWHFRVDEKKTVYFAVGSKGNLRLYSWLNVSVLINGQVFDGSDQPLLVEGDYVEIYGAASDSMFGLKNLNGGRPFVCEK